MVINKGKILRDHVIIITLYRVRQKCKHLYKFLTSQFRKTHVVLLIRVKVCNFWCVPKLCTIFECGDCVSIIYYNSEENGAF